MIPSRSHRSGQVLQRLEVAAGVVLVGVGEALQATTKVLIAHLDVEQLIDLFRDGLGDPARVCDEPSDVTARRREAVRVWVCAHAEVGLSQALDDSLKPRSELSVVNLKPHYEFSEKGSQPRRGSELPR